VFAKFLEKYNVSRVALIYGPESSKNVGPAFQNSPYNIKNAILSTKIKLIANIAVPYRLLSESDKNSTFKLLKSTDARSVIHILFISSFIKIKARYIIVMGQPQTIADVYFGARSVNFKTIGTCILMFRVIIGNMD
jgi:hypothetical protein